MVCLFDQSMFNVIIVAVSASELASELATSYQSVSSSLATRSTSTIVVLFPLLYACIEKLDGTVLKERIEKKVKS